MVERQRSTACRDDHLHEEKVARCILLRPKEQREQCSCRVVNRRKKGETWAAPFQPIVRTGINLHERPPLPAPFPSAALLWRSPRPWTTDPFRKQNAAHTRPGEGDSFLLAQLFGQMHLIEADILPHRHSPHRVAPLL